MNTKGKVCKICGTAKPLKEFVRHKNYKDKHTDVCIECNRLKYQHSFRNEVLNSLKRIEDKLK